MDSLKYIDEKLEQIIKDENNAMAQYNFVLGYKEALLDFKKAATQPEAPAKEDGESDGN